MDLWLINMAKKRAGGALIHEVCGLSQALVSLQNLADRGDAASRRNAEVIRQALHVLVRTGALPPVKGMRL